MRLLIIVVVLALMGALGIYLSLPEGQWLLEQFAHNQASIWLQGQMQQVGLPMGSYGLQILLGLGLIALLLVLLLAKKAKKRESRDQEYEASLDEKDEEIARLEKALDEHTEPKHTTETEKRAALKREEDDFGATLDLVDEYLTELRGRLGVYNDNDQAEEGWSERLQALKSSLTATRSNFGAYRKHGKLMDLISELEAVSAQSSQKIEDFDEEEFSEREQGLADDLSEHERSFGLIQRRTESLAALLERARDLDDRLGAEITGNSGLTAQAREGERLVEQLKIRFKQLKPDSGGDIVTRINTIANEISNLERDTDKLDIDTSVQRIEGLRKRLTGLAAQLGRDASVVPMRAAE